MTLRSVLGTTAFVAVVAVLGACSDGTPAFCNAFADMVGLEELSAALSDGDLSAADAEARRLDGLADQAPSEIRADLRALATAVVDTVALLQAEQSAEGTADVGPSEVERRRDDLNDRFGDLDRRSERITTWMTRECGIEVP